MLVCTIQGLVYPEDPTHYHYRIHVKCVRREGLNYGEWMTTSHQAEEGEEYNMLPRQCITG